MVYIDIIYNGLIFSMIGNGYLLMLMRLFSPRIWGYQDYSDKIKFKVLAQTRRERIIAGIVSIPWIIFMISFPLYSTFMIKTSQGNEIDFIIAFMNILVMVGLFFIGDMVVLDWLIISKWTPDFVIIEGSEKKDYKDFSHHYRGHALAIIPLIIICLGLTIIVTFS